MSAQPPKGSKRHRIRKWAEQILQTGGDRGQVSRQTSEHPGSSISRPAGTQPSPFMLPGVREFTTPNDTSTAQSLNETGFPTGASALGVASVAKTVNTGPGPAAVNKVKVAGNTAWLRLKSSLKVLEKGVDAFAPLKSALSGLIDCLDVVEAAAANRKDYEELAINTKLVAESLKEYLTELGSEERSPSITYLSSSIEAQVLHIREKRARRKTEELLESTQDGDDVIMCYRKIDALFRQLQCDVTLRTWKNTDKQRMELLLQNLSPAGDARYNSRYSTTIKRRGCTKETREKVQVDLQDWVRDPDGAKVNWMNGMAGTGKTTIAYSLCEWLEKSKLLGASFFCSRSSPSCRDGNEIVPTIAYQLARYSPAFRSSLCKLLDTDPDAGKLAIVQQFQRLIQDPLQEVKDAIPGNAVVVIDALDECENTRGVRMILQALLRFAGSSPLKFFITSRPEPIIVERMRSETGYLPSVFYLHDVEQAVVGQDIKRFIAEELSGMHPPPSEDDIAHLVKRAGKLFIYAATVVRYIYPEDTLVDSSDRLQIVLQLQPEPAADNEPSRKYDELDELYTNILNTALGKHLEAKEMRNRRLVLWTIVCLQEPLTTSALATLLDLTELQISLTARSLGSVLHISDDTRLVSTLHASFPDYMLNKLRSKSFHCDAFQQSLLLSCRCFEVMRQQLHFNICNLGSSAVFDQDIPELPERIAKFISPALSYACSYWSEHMRLAPFTTELDTHLANFLSNRLLFWMEVINLERRGGVGVKAMLQAKNQAKGLAGGIITKMQLADAQDFVTRFFSNASSRSTPHIYLSALPYCTRTNTVQMQYSKRLRKLMNIEGTTISQRRQHLRTTWSIGTKVEASALSSDGTRIAFGTWYAHSGPSRTVEYIVRIRNLYTGDDIAEPLVGHSTPILSVAFSADGARVVSGSGKFRGVMAASGSVDCTVRVWDAHTGSLIAGPFQGHTGPINSVAFSPDGTRIVSGSGGFSSMFDSSGPIDCTIRVWDVQTGSLIVGPFEGHTGPVNSVAFSPDSRRIVSGSGMSGSLFDPSGPVVSAIQVWEANTGILIAGSFEGHTEPVNSVAVSPDGARIASGSGCSDGVCKSKDCTVRVWDSKTGRQIHLLQGHTDPVYSVAFSPNGARIVSGSGGFSNTSKNFAADCTIRVWDAHTGSLIAGPFEGHTGPIRSVAFSVDESLIVSSSDDGTIRQWDAQLTNPISGPSLGKSSPIQSIAFSRDCRLIVSGSGELGRKSEPLDCTVRVWDAHTGGLIVGPLAGHITPVRSVAFAPDGLRIASGSGTSSYGNEGIDCTIRVWDARAGNLIAGPLEGHSSPINSVAFSPDGAYIVSSPGGSAHSTSSIDWTIRVWDAHTGNLIADPFEDHTSPVHCIAFSPDGTCIASGSGGLKEYYESADHAMQVQDMHARNPASALPGEDAIDTSPNSSSYDSESISSGSEQSNLTLVSELVDCTIRVWDPHTGILTAGPFEGHTGPVISLAFSPDGTRIVSGSGFSENIFEMAGSSIRVWDTHTGSLIAGPFERDTTPIDLVAFSVDGAHIIFGGSSSPSYDPFDSTNNCIISVLDAYTGDEIVDPFIWNMGLVQSIALSPDGTLVAVSSRLHQTSTQKLRILTLDREAYPYDTFSGPWVSNPDGWITADNTPVFWAPPDLHEDIPLPPEKLVIGRDGSTYIDYRGLALGENWAECYIPESSSL